MSDERSDAGALGFIRVRDENGREWQGAVTIWPLRAKDGSGDYLSGQDIPRRSLVVTEFKVVEL